MDSGQLQTLGRVLDHILREYRECLCRFREEEIAEKKTSSVRKKSHKGKSVPAPTPGHTSSANVNASCSPAGPMGSEQRLYPGEQCSVIDDLLKSLSG